MSEHKDPRSCKSQLRGWSTMIFIIILQLTDINGGESPANSQHRMFAVIGHTQSITLPCSVSPATDVVDEMVEWSRSDLNPRFVHVRRSGEDYLVNQNPSYKERTSMPVDGLKTGDVPLKVTKVRLSDEGTYRCFIPRLKTDFNVELVVEADIQIIKVRPGVLECKSEGWYPEAEVFWLEREGKLLSAGSKETFRGPDDLCALSSRLTLEKGHSNNFTCRIQQNNLHRDATIYVPDDFFMKSCSSTRSVIGLIAGVMFISVVLFLVWKWRKNKRENKKSSKDGESQSGREDKRCSSSKETKPLIRNKKEGKGESEAPMVQGKVEVNQPAHANKQQGLSCENKHGVSNCPAQITQSESQQNNDQPERNTTNEMCSDEVTQSGEKKKDLAEQETHQEPLETNTEIPNESLMESSGREDSICSSNKKTQKESLTKNKEECNEGSETPMVRGTVEVNQPACASKQPELSCENEHISNYPPEITQSERQQNNDQPERDTTNEMCSEKNTQIGNKTPALTEIETHPEPGDSNPENPNQSPMDSTGQQQQLKQGEEVTNDTDKKEDKKKTQTINDETAGPSPSAEEGEQTTEGQKNSEFQTKDRNGERTETRNHDTPETNVSEPNSAKGAETEEGQDNREDSVSAEQPDNNEEESGNTSATDEGPDVGDQQEENSTKSKDAISGRQDQNNDGNGERTQTGENKTTDSTEQSTSQNDHSVGGESQNGQDDTGKSSKRQTDTQPSHLEENGTNQVPPSRTEQPNIKENESGTTSATDDSSVNGDQQQQSIKSQNATSDQEAQNNDTNGEKTEATNVAETADSPGRHVSQHNPAEGEEATKGPEDDSKPTSDVQPTDPEGTNQNPSGSTEETEGSVSGAQQ